MIKLLRVLMRVSRATFAQAVLVVRNSDGRVLALASQSEGLRLPRLQLDAWRPIPLQVESWLYTSSLHTMTPCLVGVEGTPGWVGINFLSVVHVDDSTLVESSEGVWLEPEVAASKLSREESRLLYICLAYRST